MPKTPKIPQFKLPKLSSGRLRLVVVAVVLASGLALPAAGSLCSDPRSAVPVG